MSKNKLILAGLLLSVAINLIFVGGISSRLSHSRDFNARPFPPNIGWAIRDLSEERRDDLASLVAESFADINPLRRQMFEAQQQVNSLMAADPFDAEAIARAFTNLREAYLRYQALSHEQTVALLSQLSDEERNLSLEFIQRGGPRGRREGFRGREGEPGLRPEFGPGRPPFSPPPDSDQ